MYERSWDGAGCGVILSITDTSEITNMSEARFRNVRDIWSEKERLESKIIPFFNFIVEQANLY